MENPLNQQNKQHSELATGGLEEHGVANYQTEPTSYLTSLG